MPRRRIRQARRTATRADRIRAGLLILGAAVLGVGIVAVDLGGDDSVVPEVASRLDPGNSDALSAMAGTLAGSDLDAASAFARRAISHNPLDDYALVIAALGATSRNDVPRADGLFAHVARMTRRQSLAETWMFDVAMEHGRYGEAIDHADAALRRRNGADVDVLPALYAVTNSSAALPAFAAKLATNPPWRAAFFDAFSRSPSGSGLALIAAMRKAGDHPTPLEVAAMASQQVAAGSTARARAVWQIGFGQPLPPLLSPNFESVLQYGDFGWAMIGKGGAQIVAGPDGNSHALMVQPSNTGKKPVRVAQQAMLLEPGRHAVTFEGRTVGDGKTVAAVVVRCAGNDDELGRAPVPAAKAWTSARIVFGVPARDCAIQKLVIEAVPNLDQSGSPALIDSFRVE